MCCNQHRTCHNQLRTCCNQHRTCCNQHTTCCKGNVAINIGHGTISVGCVAIYTGHVAIKIGHTAIQHRQCVLLSSSTGYVNISPKFLHKLYISTLKWYCSICHPYYTECLFTTGAVLACNPNRLCMLTHWL